MRTIFSALLIAAPLLASAGTASATMPHYAVDADQVSAKLRKLPSKLEAAGPIQFAVAVDTEISLAHGAWQVNADTAIWQLAIDSAEALNLNLKLEQLQLPAGATLNLRTPDGSVVHGPYTAADAIAGTLWTPVVPGATAVLELRSPAAVMGEVALQVSRVHHGYREFLSIGSAKAHDPGLGSSGSCNIDVACPQGNDWRDEIRSAVRLQITGTGLCTGLLVNNFRQNEDPLVLTADHCEIGNGGPGSIDGQDASPSSVVFYFNLENAVCNGNSETANLTQTVSGSSFVADDVNSDFTLLRMNSAAPAAYNVYFAGFDAGTATPTSGVTLHHPSGDTKKISVFSTSAQTSSVTLSPGRVVGTWKVFWSAGTTEPGSSGAGLWNSAHRVVGLLSGGVASCSQQGAEDHFGRLDLAWEPNASSSRQLRAHLDPDSCGLRGLDGKTSGSSNQVPTPANDSFSFGRTQTNQTLDVLANDSDPDAGQTLLIAAIDTAGTQGAVSIATDSRSIRYTPASSGSTTDSFRYTVQDNLGSCLTATVNIQITGDVPSSSGGSGGGALSLWGLIGLASLSMLRRRRHA